MKNFSTKDSLLVVTDVVDFIAKNIPPRTYYLSPWLTKSSLSMVYAQTGVGKTHLTMNIAHALSTGGEFLGWKATNPIRVLYVDGEMSMEDLQSRLKGIIKSAGVEPHTGFFKQLARSEQLDGIMPNLYTIEGQNAYSEQFEPFDVIVIDNLSSLVTGCNENEAESWESIQQWAIQQRSKGKSIIFVHHAGKNNSQRGTSKRTDLMDVVIKLERKADYIQEEGAEFQVIFEKARSLFGSQVVPFVAKLSRNDDGVESWNRVTTVDDDVEVILGLQAEGLNQTEIAEKLGFDKATISRKLKRWNAKKGCLK